MPGSKVDCLNNDTFKALHECLICISTQIGLIAATHRRQSLTIVSSLLATRELGEKPFIVQRIFTILMTLLIFLYQNP